MRRESCARSFPRPSETIRASRPTRYSLTTTTKFYPPYALVQPESTTIFLSQSCR